MRPRSICEPELQGGGLTALPWLRSTIRLGFDGRSTAYQNR